MNSSSICKLEYFQNYHYGQSKHTQVAMLLYRNLLHSLYISKVLIERIYCVIGGCHIFLKIIDIHKLNI